MQSLNLNALLKKANYHRPLIFNSVLWVLAFTILLFIFSKGKSPIAVDYIYTVTFLVVLSVPVSINFYVLIPRFLKHEKYVLYCIFFIVNKISICIFFKLLIFLQNDKTITLLLTMSMFTINHYCDKGFLHLTQILSI